VGRPVRPYPCHYIDIHATDRMQLNNYLQCNYKNQTTLSWVINQVGSEHNSDWEAIAYGMIFCHADLLIVKGCFGTVNHEKYGHGTAAKRDDAKEEAARQALVNLRGW
jgi:dsRNA-specific ribonuclease